MGPDVITIVAIFTIVAIVTIVATPITIIAIATTIVAIWSTTKCRDSDHNCGMNAWTWLKDDVSLCVIYLCSIFQNIVVSLPC